MQRKFYAAILVFSIMLSTCIFIGCSDSKSGGSQGLKKGKIDMSSWPNDVPKFKDGTPAHIVKNDAGIIASAIFSNIKNPGNAYKNYKKALLNRGWILLSENSGEVSWAGSFEKGSDMVTVNVQKDGVVAQLMFILR